MTLLADGCFPMAVGFIFLWWFFRGCSPLPIPNREVKPLMADGTAPQCGRVGSCHIHLSLIMYLMRLFYFPLRPPSPRDPRPPRIPTAPNKKSPRKPGGFIQRLIIDD